MSGDIPVRVRSVNRTRRALGGHVASVVVVLEHEDRRCVDTAIDQLRRTVLDADDNLKSCALDLAREQAATVRKELAQKKQELEKLREELSFTKRELEMLRQRYGLK